MTTDDYTTAAHAAAREYARTPRMNVGTVRDRIAEAHMAGTEWACDYLTTQEESVLMTSREETISDRLSDAGYTEYAEDEDGGVTWVSAPLGEVLRIVSAAQEPTDAELDALYDAFVAHSEDERSEEYTRTEDGEPYSERICTECGEAVWIKGEHHWAATRANGARKRHHVARAALRAARDVRGQA